MSRKKVKLNISGQPFRQFLSTLRNSKLYTFCIIAGLVASLACIIGDNISGAREQIIIPLNLIVASVYCVDFICRMIGYAYYRDTKRKYLIFDVLIAIAQLAFILLYTWFFESWKEVDPTILLLKFTSIIRFFRLFFSFSSSIIYIQVLLSSFGEIFSLLFCAYIVLILYAIIGMSWNWHYDESLGFPEYNFGFHSVTKASVTLLSFGSSNSWQIINEMCNRVDVWFLPRILSSSFAKIYFYFFYLMFIIFWESFSLIIFIKYQNVSNGTCGLGEKEIAQFKRVWKDLFLFRPTITYRQLIEFLSKLDHPLGIKTGKHEHISYKTRLSFVRNVLLHMSYPHKAASIRFSIYRPKTYMECIYNDHPTSPMYLDDNLTIAQWDPNLKFSFGQVLIAVHRAVIVRTELRNADVIAAKRKLGNYYLGNIKYYIMRQQAEMSYFRTTQSAVVQKLLQQCNLELYREIFINVMNNEIIVLRNSLNSFGLNSFRVFCLHRLNIALGDELRRATIKQTFETLFVEQVYVNKPTHSELLRLFYANKYKSNIELLKRKLLGLTTKYVPMEWNVDNMLRVHKFSFSDTKSKVEITALVLDSSNFIYIGSNTGTVKIYSPNGDMLHQNNIEVNSNFFYQLQQTLQVAKAAVGSIAVSNSGSQLIVSVDSIIFVYLPTNNSNDKSKAQFTQLMRLTQHKSTITKLIIYSNCFISCGLDGACLLWKANSPELPRMYRNSSSPILCCSLFIRTTQAMHLLDYARNCIICGTNNGKMIVLPQPHSHSKPPMEGVKESDFITEAWKNPYQIQCFNKNTAITALVCAWDLVYTGSSDGEIKIFSVNDVVLKHNKVQDDRFSFQHLINICILESKAVHANTVSGLVFTGNHLFSTSHDLSVITWPSPHRFGGRFGFQQTCERGVVDHNCPISAVDGNTTILATGDSAGNVLIRKAAQYQPAYRFQCYELFNASEVEFSFREYDFGCCTLGTLGNQSLSYETKLVITNKSMNIHQLRCPTLKCSCFSIVIESNISLSNFHHKGILLDPYSSIVILVIFAPFDVGSYEGSIAFTVDDLTTHIIEIKGRCTNTVITMVENESIIDFGSVQVFDECILTRTFHNESQIAVTFECLDVFSKASIDIFANESSSDEEDDGGLRKRRNQQNQQLMESEKSQFSALSQVGITIAPPIFTLEPKTSVEIKISFIPHHKINSFDVPLRIAYRGRVHNIVQLTGRSKFFKKIDVPIDDIYRFVQPDSREYLVIRSNEILTEGVLCNCVANLSNMLRQQGWSYNSLMGSTALVNKTSGFFIELIDPTKSANSSDQEGPSSNITPYSPSTVMFAINCEIDCNIEIWCKDVKIADAIGEGESLHTKYCHSIVEILCSGSC